MKDYNHNNTKKMKTIVHITSEVAPFFKRGGLGDVLASLPVYLEEDGCHNIVITLFYDGKMLHLDNCTAHEFSMLYQGVYYEFTVYYLERKNIDYYFIKLVDSWILSDLENKEGAGPYCEPPSILPYFYFAKAALQVISSFEIFPDLIFCHDWQSVGIFGYTEIMNKIKTQSGCTTVFLIHNYHYQGEVYEDIIAYLEPDPACEIQELFSRYGSASLLALGLKNCDHAATVSLSYAKELVDGHAPHAGLKYLGLCAGKVIGFLNGIDPGIWKPENNLHLPVSFNMETLDNKKKIKKEVMEKFGFRDPGNIHSPLALMLCRLTFQKGINFFIDFPQGLQAMKEYAAEFLDPDTYLVVLGTPGDGINGIIDNRFSFLQEQFPGRFLYINNYSEALAHLFLAAADILIAPSLFEPCGLVQIYAMAYGTVPVVNPVGGMKDTVRCYFQQPSNATGFYIDSFNRTSVLQTIKKVINVFYYSPGDWRKIMERGMQEDFSWAKMIKQYQAFFERVERDHMKKTGAAGYRQF
ncbi:MAG: glycogen/starch synthase [Acidobacteria bacterium]|nr:glycogen/starch synthase [Acidobacteriota bacterium]